MNIYKFHTNPDQLKYHAEATERIPVFAWEKYENKTKELRKREAVWATSAKYSYEYARVVLRKPFPLGEAAIATNAEYSYRYAQYVLRRKRFPAGEPAIAGDVLYSYRYARDVLKVPFPQGEAAIAGNAWYSYRYAKEFNLKIVDGKFVPK